VDYCSRIIKKYIGRDFRDYINMLRIRKAQALMLDKSLNMTTLEILYKCGFHSAATFYRAKKRFENELKIIDSNKKEKSEE
jgi:YesN/AraC family two-component response regulator